ncbi:MAG: hypothetical protein HFF36_07920 [Coprobacillus sp.]|nr:hypothetical protein [Coprobacillus sp.]
MKKLFIGIMCIILMVGCTTTKNTEKEPASVPKQEETVKKEDEQKTDQSKKNDEDKKEVKKTETKTDTKKDDTKNKTTVSKKTETKKSTSTKKKTTTTTKKPTTKKKTTPKKKVDTVDGGKPTDFGCIECGKHFTSYDKLDEHLIKTNHGGYSIGYETTECPDDWIFIE